MKTTLDRKSVIFKAEMTLEDKVILSTALRAAIERFKYTSAVEDYLRIYRELNNREYEA